MNITPANFSTTVVVSYVTTEICAENVEHDFYVGWEVLESMKEIQTSNLGDATVAVSFQQSRYLTTKIGVIE
jgi:hypothetical protein